MTAEQKKSPRKPKSFLDQEKYTAELSPGQLVLGISALLIFGLACFMLGIVVGKVEPSDPPRLAQRFDAPSPGGATPEDRGIEFEAPADSPPNLSASGSFEDASGGNAASESEPDERIANDARAGNWDAVNSEGGATEASPGDDGPNHIPLPPTATPDAEGTEAPPQLQAASPVFLAVVEPPVHEESGANESSRPAGESAEAPGPGRVVDTSIAQGDLPFSVQVMALGDRQKAIVEKAKIEEKSEYTVRLRSSPNGRFVHILVGAFATRSEAESAKEDIRKNLDYTDAYVRKVD